MTACRALLEKLPITCKECCSKEITLFLDNRQHFFKYPNSFLNEITDGFLKCLVITHLGFVMYDTAIAAKSNKRRLFLAAIPAQVPRTGQTPAYTHTFTHCDSACCFIDDRGDDSTFYHQHQLSP